MFPEIQNRKSHSRFFALVTVIFGAVSSVGIWFTIGLIQLAATVVFAAGFVLSLVIIFF